MSTSTEDRARGAGTTRARTAAPPKPRTGRVRPAPTRPAPRTGGGSRPLGNAPRMPFVLLILGLLGGALITLLVLRTVLAQDAFAISTLRQETRELHHEEQALRESILHAESPDAIGEAAEDLGMEPGEAPEFIDLETGQVRGAEPDVTAE